MSFAGQSTEAASLVNAADPLSAIKSLNGLSSTDGTALLVLRNFHRFLGSAEIVQALDTAIAAGKENRTSLVVLSPVIQIPVELEEKALSGVGSTGDSGVSSRLFGTLLTYLSDHESDVFVVASANGISKLPPELARAERFDGVFFLDLPGSRERETIWQIYIRKFGLDPAQQRPQDRDWTGAEIRSCCRLSALLDIPLSEAGTNIVPVAVTAAEAVERLRNWAAGRCLSADRPGI